MMEVVKFKEIAEIITGSTPSTKNSNFYDGMYLFVSPADLGSNKWINKSKKHLSQSGFEVSRVIPKNATLLCCIGATIGKVGIAGTDLTTNQQINSIVFDKNKVDPEYGYYYCTTLKETLISKSHSTTLPIISKGKLSELKIPLPPLPTQKKIAAILDAADAYRQKTKALIEKYDELTQSLFLDMFGDPVVNEKGWEKKPMGELMKIVRGGSPRPIDKFLGGKYPWIKIGDATKGDDIYLEKTKQHIIEEGLKKTRLLPKGSLIFANCGVSLGFARIIQFEGCIHDGWLAFSELDDTVLNELFLLKALNSITRYFRETAPDGTQPNLNSSIMKSFNIILPPIELQNKFEVSLKVIIKQKAQAQESLEKAEELFNSLLGRAFKGELKV
ncbi:restriction endonuclease subunit S [Brumimicrobium sp.]|uniref:restriction endonuclease subunit S n=1 Tax=Brumimicrobium sp. TaxID=2029867 RepID=UPI003A9578D6